MSVDPGYGNWNVLLAYSENDEFIARIPAHDGDFFPESPFDHIEAIRSRIKSRTKQLASPIRLDLDITQKCNANCIFCFARLYRPLKDYENAVVPAQLIRNLLPVLRDQGMRCLRLTGGGEPLTCSYALDTLELAHKIGLKTALLTNGDLIGESEITQILNCCDHLRVSVDASCNRTRYRLHGPNSRGFKELLNILEKICIRRTNKYQPLIWTTFLLTDQNIDDIPAAAKLMKDAGVDSISYRPIYRGLRGNITKAVLRENLLRAKSSESQEFKVFIPKRDIDEADNLAPSEHFRYCISIFHRTILEATNRGPVIKLCGMYRGDQGSPIGFVHNVNDLLQIWQGDHILRVGEERPYTCPRCIDVSMNVTLNMIDLVLKECPEAKFRKANVSNRKILNKASSNTMFKNIENRENL